MSENNLPVGYAVPNQEQEQAIRRAKTRAFRWPKGQSGNPSGHTKIYYETRKLAHNAAPEMMRELIKLATTAEDERVRSVCVIAVLDRAGIKPIEAEVMLDQLKSEQKGSGFNPADYSIEELNQIEGALRLIMKRRDEKLAANTP